MNKYGNALLDEYYGMQERNKKKITLLHVDYVETFPKKNGSYDSYHTDIDSSGGGGNDGGGGGDCDDWGPIGTIVAIGAGVCCCMNTETVCECFGDCLASMIEGLCDACC